MCEMYHQDLKLLPLTNVRKLVLTLIIQVKQTYFWKKRNKKIVIDGVQ